MQISSTQKQELLMMNQTIITKKCIHISKPTRNVIFKFREAKHFPASPYVHQWSLHCYIIKTITIYYTLYITVSIYTPCSNYFTERYFSGLKRVKSYL